MIEVLRSLKKQAESFESTAEAKDIFLVHVINIGYNLRYAYRPHAAICDKLGYNKVSKGSDGSWFEQ